MTTQILDRVPRYASLLGLLGLAGIAGIFNPELSRLSFLSFLSYLCYFRFLLWFGKQKHEVTVVSILVPCLGGFLPLALIGSDSVSPMLGFIGFAGFCGLYDSSNQPAKNPGA